VIDADTEVGRRRFVETVQRKAKRAVHGEKHAQKKAGGPFRTVEQRDETDQQQ